MVVVHNWTGVGQDVRGSGQPERRASSLAEIIIQHFGEEKTIVGGYHSPAHSLLTEIIRQNPVDVWKMITPFLGPPRDSRAFRLKSWLQGRLVPDSIGRYLGMGGRRQNQTERLILPVSDPHNSLFHSTVNPSTVWRGKLLVRYGSDVCMSGRVYGQLAFLRKAFRAPGAIIMNRKNSNLLLFQQK